MVLALVSATASAAVANSLTITRVGGYYSGAGGEFNVTSSDAQLQGIFALYDAKATVNGGFETFCVEENEFVSIPQTYTYAISDAAKAGGVGGAVNGKDPISLGAAWLYSQFAGGSLAGYNYTPGGGRVASAGLLQNAIWWLEDEINLANPLSNQFLAAAIGQFGASVKSDNNGAFGVGVLNLGVNSSNQDQIILVPDGGVTIALFGAALLALGIIRRRRA